MSLAHLHPAVTAWFERTFAQPTEVQRDAWATIAKGQHTLIAAPTGSGKTLAAFLTAIDSLVRQAARGYIEDATQVVYVSPLKALSNDIERNLQAPLMGISELLMQQGFPATEIRAQVRTGDTPIPERSAMRKRPPHILVTTPESLYLLLTSASGREILSTTRTVIVDEIHALAGSKRGAHLALSLQRLDALVPHAIQRIGLSATQKPIEDVANFLVGRSSSSSATSDAGQEEAQRALSPTLSPIHSLREEESRHCTIVNTGHVRERDLQLVLPGAPLEAVMSNNVWQTVYDQLAQLIDAHHTTLVFANTRRMVERVARQLTERLGEQQVAAHHGSLSKETRFDAEQRLKAGKLRVLVASASLELGIDIGDVDLVCQLGSPRSITAFLQRVGRANHSVNGVPKGRLFPLSRDELVECTALLDAVKRGELDRLIIPAQPLDVLAQQIVAEVAAREWREDALFTQFTQAWNYRELTREQFNDVLTMLSDGYATRRGRQSAYLHRDQINGTLRARKGARLTAITCGGAIPDVADYHVLLEPQETFIGTLNEDFAIESQAGDIFQLGNASYRILRIESGRVRVEDAKGLPPTLPFWLGEAPARTAELSQAVSRLRQQVNDALPANDETSLAQCVAMLMDQHLLNESAARQLVEYLAAAKVMLGQLPTQQQLVLERFFDESGGMQLVIHSPFGARMNRAFGLALRKRFCRSFNFELQAAATEDAVTLSLGETHSFELRDVAHYLNSQSVRETLIQAMLDSPLFTTRWRWVASISLAIQRFRGGKRTPAPLQRMASEDLISVVFPEQLACLENIQGDREIPDHPLVNQAIHDCLYEAMDIGALENMLRGIERNEINVIACDLPTPSPLAQEILTAKPYAFLDDAPLEERRTQAVASRRWLDPQTAAEFGQLDAQAIARVRDEAWPSVDNADELHDALMSMDLCTEAEAQHSGWQRWFDELLQQRRVTVVNSVLPSPSERGAGSEDEDKATLTLPLFLRERGAEKTVTRSWIAAERIPMLQAIYPHAQCTPALQLPTSLTQQTWTAEDALVELLRGRLQVSGPITVTRLVEDLQLTASRIDMALLKLETQGFVMRGQFTPGSHTLEWCERRLLARIHRYTVERLRAAIEPVSAADFMRFLLQWQGVIRLPKARGVEALQGLLEQLQGIDIPAAAWESEVLPARMQDYDPAWLDSLCLSGRMTWLRLQASASGAAPVRNTPIVLLPRAQVNQWQQWTGATATTPDDALSHAATRLLDYLNQHGASFFNDMLHGSGLLQAQAEEGLAELVSAGLVSADSFSGLRALVLPMDRKRKMVSRGLRIAQFGLEDAGRWSLLRRRHAEPASDLAALAFILLKRYGVVFRKLLAHENPQLPAWHELLRTLRQLEAQGLIRGGRFVAGITGEQYALPEAVNALRAIRKQTPDGQLVSLSAADPLNLSGVLIPGPRIPALMSNRLLIKDGSLVASLIGGQTTLHENFAPAVEWTVRNALLHKRMPGTTTHSLN
jgi:ATP-dependent helicase Lhr and Lhr-like helicase